MNLVWRASAGRFKLSQCSAGASLRNRIQTLHGFTIISNHIFIYTLELGINLLDFNPAYPRNPETFGEKLRKARMDKHLQIKELARLIGVSPDSVINWEMKGVRPRENYMAGLRKFI